MGRVKKRLLDRLISCETGEIFQAMAVTGYDANHLLNTQAEAVTGVALSK